MEPSFTFLVVVFIACNVIRTGYERLKETGKIEPGNKPVFIVILASMILLWVSWFGMCPDDPFHAGLPAAVRWFGLIIFIGGLAIAVYGIVLLKRPEDTTHLVTTGIFRKMRHPIYNGFICWIFGWSLYNDAMGSLVVGLLSVANIRYWGRLEEIRLLAKYGDEYRRYHSQTWF